MATPSSVRYCVTGGSPTAVISVNHTYSSFTRDLINVCSGVWQEIESRGIGTNFFLSTQGWEMGLDLVMYAHQLLANITVTEMATTMEAIVGAVARDCAGEAVVVSRVMRSLGLFWPETDAEMAYLRSRLSILRALRVLPSGENGSYQ
jgi:hypothetical protein